MRHIRSFGAFIAPFMLLFILIPSAVLAEDQFAWDANTETDLAGYRLYWGSAPGDYSDSLDVENVTKFPIDPQFRNQLTFLALTAFDTQGNESEFSSELRLDLRIVPVIIRNENATLMWNPSESSDVVGYKVVWRMSENPEWSFEDVGNTNELLLSALSLPDSAYQFSVVAYDAYGNESPIESILDVQIDTTPPDAPKGLKIIFGD